MNPSSVADQPVWSSTASLLASVPQEPGGKMDMYIPWVTDLWALNGIMYMKHLL